MRRLLMCFIVSLCAVGAPAAAVTLEEIAALKALLPGAQIKIRDTRTLIIFRAVTGEPAECWVLRATETLGALRQSGYRLDQISVSTPPATLSLSQAQCYAIPVQ